MTQRLNNLFLVLFIVTGCRSLPQQTQELSADGSAGETVLESYDSRPEVSTIPRLGMDNATANRLDRKAGISWSNYVNAMIETAAQFWGHVIGLGINHHAYLMGRDAALLYDVIRLYGNEFYPDDLHRVHLINVSQKSVDSPHLKEYLAGHEISDEVFKGGRVVHIWDTGWRGVTLGKVRAMFPKYKDRFFINFGASQNLGQENIIPSSRLFFGLVYPDLENIAPHSYRDRVRTLENLPRFMARAQGYTKLSNGRYEACVFAKKTWEEQKNLAEPDMLPTRRAYDKQQLWDSLFGADKRKFIQEYEALARQRNERAVRVMGNLARRLEEPEMKNLFEQRLFLHWEISDVISTGDRDAVVEHFNKLLDESPNSFEIEAIVRDAVEKVERHYPEIGFIDRKKELRLPKAFKRGSGRLPASGVGQWPTSSPPQNNDFSVTPQQPGLTSNQGQPARNAVHFRTFVDAERVLMGDLNRPVLPVERIEAMEWLLSEFAPSENLDRVFASVYGDADAEVRVRAVKYVAQNGLRKEALRTLASSMRKTSAILDPVATTVAVRALEEGSVIELLELYKFYRRKLDDENTAPELKKSIEALLVDSIFVAIADLCHTQERVLKERLTH